VAANSGAHVVAAALVQRVREGVVPCLTAIGPEAVGVPGTAGGAAAAARHSHPALLRSPTPPLRALQACTPPLPQHPPAPAAPRQVCNCVLAIGQARVTLEPSGLDLRARPEFISVQKNGADLHALKFTIHVERVA
jgi:stage V sporulation protein SpoVS